MPDNPDPFDKRSFYALLLTGLLSVALLMWLRPHG